MENQWLKDKFRNVWDFMLRDMTALGRVLMPKVPDTDFSDPFAAFETVLGVPQEMILVNPLRVGMTFYTSPYPDGQKMLKSQIDPSKHNVMYSSSGRRVVFWRGQWVEDDPGNWFADLAARTTVTKGTNGLPTLETTPRTGNYRLVDDDGNYILPDGTLARPGTMQYLEAKYGDAIPDFELENSLNAEASDVLSDVEAAMLDWIERRKFRQPGLVHIGKPIEPGETFTINGHRAIMGQSGQYAVTQPGAGDRWKYKTVKDEDGNWMRVYYRTFGAKKEKQMREEKKGKK